MKHYVELLIKIYTIYMLVTQQTSLDNILTIFLDERAGMIEDEVTEGVALPV